MSILRIGGENQWKLAVTLVKTVEGDMNQPKHFNSNINDIVNLRLSSSSITRNGT